MPKKIDVYGLTDQEVAELRAIAFKKYGRASVSFLAKKLLQEQLGSSSSINHTQPQRVKARMELRLPRSLQTYLKNTAETLQMTANMVVLHILMEHMDKYPVISNNEVQALYQSNYQLLRIGRNLNQIARQLNAGEGVSITTQHIQELIAVIDAHTERVNSVLLDNRKRLDE